MYFFTFFFGTGTINPSTYDIAIILSVVGFCSRECVGQEWQQEGVLLPWDSYSSWRFTHSMICCSLRPFGVRSR